MAVRFCHIFLLLFCYGKVSGQTTEFYFTKDISIKYKEFTKVKKIHKDTRGFLWIASQDGLICTDGNSSVLYSTTSEPVHKISETDIWDICEDRKAGELYVLSSSGTVDIIAIASGHIKSSLRIGGFAQDNWYMSLVKSGNRLWLSSYKGIFIYDIDQRTTQKLQVNTRGGDISLLCSKLMLQGKDSIWFHLSGAGLFLFNTVTQKQLLYFPNDFLSKKIRGQFFVNDLCSLPGNRLLIASNQGLYEIETGQSNGIGAKVSHINTGGTVPESVHTLQNFNESVILTTNRIYRYFPASKRCIPVHSSQPENGGTAVTNITATFLDTTQKLFWYISDTKLKYLKLGTHFLRGFTSSNPNINFKDVFYVHPGKNTVYISCSNGFFKQNENETMVAVDTTAEYYYQFTVNKDVDIVSSGNGLKALANNKLTAAAIVYPEFKKYSQVIINSAVNLQTGEWLMGTEDFKGALIWDINKHTIRNVTNTGFNGLPGSNIVNSVYATDNHRFVLSDKSVAVYDQKFRLLKRLAFTKQQLTDSAATYFSVSKIRSNYYFASYGNGLICTDNNFNQLYHINTQNGLCDDGVYNLFAAGDSALYITTNHGISILNVNTGKIKNLFKEDGLHGNRFEEAASQFNNGIIYAGGANGFTVINPGDLRYNTAPPGLFVYRVDIETEQGKLDTADFQIERIAVPNDAIQTTLYLSAINWLSPEQVKYSWRIIEKGEKWTDSSTQNMISLIGLPPDTYHLQVKAANEDGVWSEPKELILVFLPKWYQTWWFYALIALTAAAILYALYRYRIYQIKKQHEIRKNIATDLHDDLGSTLNSVKVFTNLAISGVKQAESLQQVKDNLTEATMSLRDMIWVLDDSMDTVDELVTRLKQFALPVTAASNMDFVIQAGSDVNARTLSKEEKRNLFLICKEAINNSIKYSGATVITVDIKPAGKKIQITIADNGKGFDEASVKKGYGLKNMQYRAGQVKYKAALISQPGKGTSVAIMPV